MFEMTKQARGRRVRDTTTALIMAATVLCGTAVVVAPSMASASGTTNTFSFSGAYSGTIKLNPSSFNCSFGKTYSGKGFLVTLSHMKGTISGAGKGPWAMSLYPSKKGTTHGATNVKSLSDGSFQSNGPPMVAFLETSGSITYKGSTGSINMKVEYHAVGSTTYGKVATVIGSWNCG